MYGDGVILMPALQVTPIRPFLLLIAEELRNKKMGEFVDERLRDESTTQVTLQTAL